MKGISNVGASCYIGSAAQAIRAMAQHSTAVALALPESLKSGDGAAVVRYHDAAAAATVPPAKPHTGMDDAAYALQLLLEPLPAVDALCRGEIRERCVCAGCRHVAVANDTFLPMVLPFDDGAGRVTTLSQCIERFFAPEQVPDYKCDGCGERGKVTKRFTCPKLPEFWIMQLKRGAAGSAMDRRVIDYPEALEQSSPNSPDVKTEYLLRAVCHHSGASLNSGHWVAEVQDRGGRWWLCDDSTAAPIAATSCANTAVILVYQRQPRKRPAPAALGAIAKARRTTPA